MLLRQTQFLIKIHTFLLLYFPFAIILYLRQEIKESIISRDNRGNKFYSTGSRSVLQSELITRNHLIGLGRMKLSAACQLETAPVNQNILYKRAPLARFSTLERGAVGSKAHGFIHCAEVYFIYLREKVL